MRQGGLILAVGRVRRRKKNTNHRNSLIPGSGANKKINTSYSVKKENNSTYVFSWRSRRRWLLAIISFTFFPVRCPLQRRNHERYVQLDLRRDNERNQKVCRELSMEYFSLLKIGAVCDISSKQHDASSSLLLK